MQAVLRSIIFPKTFVAPALVAGLRDRERVRQPCFCLSMTYLPNETVLLGRNPSCRTGTGLCVCEIY